MSRGLLTFRCRSMKQSVSTGDGAESEGSKVKQQLKQALLLHANLFPHSPAKLLDTVQLFCPLSPSSSFPLPHLSFVLRCSSRLCSIHYAVAHLQSLSSFHCGSVSSLQMPEVKGPAKEMKEHSLSIERARIPLFSLCIRPKPWVDIESTRGPFLSFPHIGLFIIYR